jgi:2-polyprenyl-6-methoxyphenol hydroxylase-like FAD-dependent oxidoreductase
VLRHDIYDLDPLPSYVRGRVALLGDAAHAMTPFLAQGACQALEDAADLTARLADASSDVSAALAAYDAARRPRTQRIARMARTDPRISLSTSGFTYGLMTRLTRLAAAGLVRRKSERLWNWTPPTLPT